MIYACPGVSNGLLRVVNHVPQEWTSLQDALFRHHRALTPLHLHLLTLSLNMGRLGTQHVPYATLFRNVLGAFEVVEKMRVNGEGQNPALTLHELEEFGQERCPLQGLPRANDDQL